MKKTSLALTLVLALFLSGCSFLFKEAEPKTFTKAGMSITLTSDFTESKQVPFTSYYMSEDALVFTLKEEFTLLEGFSDYTLNEYCQLVIDNGQKAATIQTEDGLTYFVFDNSANGNDYSYFCTVYKATDAFWLVQFACLKEDYDKFADKFKEWAKTVSFS